MLKNKICLIFMALSLALPVYAEEQEAALAEQEPQTEETVMQKESVPAENLMENQLKQPVSKRRVAKKFLLAMFGVAVSSGIIYYGLTIYNKIRDGVVLADNSAISPEEDKSLDTPENLSEAVKTFIEKTKWE